MSHLTSTNFISPLSPTTSLNAGHSSPITSTQQGSLEHHSVCPVLATVSNSLVQKINQQSTALAEHLTYSLTNPEDLAGKPWGVKENLSNIVFNNLKHQDKYDQLDALPTEILSYLAGFLDEKDIANLRINKNFDEIIYQNSTFPDLLLKKMINKPSIAFDTILACVTKYGSLIKTLDLSALKFQLTDSQFVLLVQNCPQLKHLNLKNQDSLTSLGLEHLKNLTQLQTLSLEDLNQITDSSLSILQSLTNLESLNLKGCRNLTDEGMVALENLAQLRSLNLRMCGKITDKALASFKSLKSLQSLDLNNCYQITDKGLKYLRSLPQLHSLYLSETKVKGESFEYLKNLKILDLQECSLSETGFMQLRNLEHLTSLNLTGCSNIQLSWLEHLQPLLHLTTLNLNGCVQVNDEWLEKLGNFTQLVSLNLSRCRQINDQGLSHLKNLIHLKSLILVNCFKLTDKGLEHLNNLQKLNNLSLQGCYYITDEGLKHLQLLINLKSLNLGGVISVTKKGISYLPPSVDRNSLIPLKKTVLKQIISLKILT